jgi:hypothetical protein
VPVDGGVSVPRATNECGRIRGVETIASAGDATVSTARALRRTDYRIATNAGALDSDFESVELDEIQHSGRNYGGTLPLRQGGEQSRSRLLRSAISGLEQAARRARAEMPSARKFCSAPDETRRRRAGRDEPQSA